MSWMCALRRVKKSSSSSAERKLSSFESMSLNERMIFCDLSERGERKRNEMVEKKSEEKLKEEEERKE